MDLLIPAVCPFPGMAHDAGTHHVQIDVHEATMKMGIGFDGGGVITIFPEGALARLVFGCTLAQSDWR